MRDGTVPAGWARTIEFLGLEIPLLALPDNPNRVVLGVRRARAVLSMKHYDEIPVYVAFTGHALDAWLVADEQVAKLPGFGPGRPWTWRERAAVLDVALACGVKGVTEPLAAYFDTHEVQLRNALYVARFAREETPEGARANAFLDLVESGELRPQSAYRKLRDGDPVIPGRKADRPRASAKDQLKALQNASGLLAGVAQELERLGDLHHDLTDDERASVREPFERARRVITRIARQLNTSKGDQE